MLHRTHDNEQKYIRVRPKKKMSNPSAYLSLKQQFITVVGKRVLFASFVPLHPIFEPFLFIVLRWEIELPRVHKQYAVSDIIGSSTSLPTHV